MTGDRQNTHLGISSRWVGEAIDIGPGRAVARLITAAAMAADERGLVHGGFTFGLADFAAMLAVNDPNVVLGACECRFLAPVRVGEEMVAEAEVLEESGNKRRVRCSVRTGRPVFEGTFSCYVLAGHVLDAG